MPLAAFYTADAEVVCEACFASAAGPTAARPRRSFIAPAGTRFERARRLRHWSIMWICFAAASLGAVNIAREQLQNQITFPVAIIETPEPGAAVPTELTVRGHVGRTSTPMPLWLVARSGHEIGCLRYLIRKSVTPNADGDFTATVTLTGNRGERYWLQLVAADPHANDLFDTTDRGSWSARHMAEEQGGRGCRRIAELEGGRLPPGATPLASVGVIQAEDGPEWMRFDAIGYGRIRWPRR